MIASYWVWSEFKDRMKRKFIVFYFDTFIGDKPLSYQCQLGYMMQTGMVFS